MADFVGSGANDTFTGTNADETIEGFGGRDTLRGGGGADKIYGGDGDDELFGDSGADRLEGGAGRDVMDGGDGNDILVGGDGDDYAVSDQGSDEISLGAGRDYLSVFRTHASSGHLRADLGADDDDMRLVSYGVSTADLDLGDGNDRLGIELFAGTATIATGAGADRIDFNYATLVPQFGTVGTFVFTDFQAGDGGDQIDWLGGLATTLTNWNHATNPFATGHLRLIQSGTDALLQIDRDGGGNSYVTVFTFKDSLAGAFTAFNFDGYNVDGSASPGTTVTGTSGNDTLSGASGNDQIDGLAGHDTLNGGAGDDTINGGAGTDQLNGELGDDVLNGGVDDDSLYGGPGNDILNGDDGDDFLSGGEGHNVLDGGSGADQITFNGVASGVGRGGDGDDTIFVVNPSAGASFTLDGGAGADSISLHRFRGTAAVSLGAGADRLIFGEWDAALVLASTDVIVADFDAGAGGDIVDIKGLLSMLPSGWDGSVNPFGSGRARLLQSGADTLLQLDGNGGGDSWETLVIFTGRTAASFAAFNFGGFAPDGSPAAGLTITGTEFGDDLHGGAGGDTIDALAGHDTVHAGAGADTLRGGDGDDWLYGESGTDILEGGNGLDRIFDGTGDDTVDGGDGDDVLWNEDGSDELIGGAGNDEFTVQRQGSEVANVTVDGGSGKDWARMFSMPGSTFNVDLGADDDLIELYNGGGVYTITLGSGADIVRPFSVFSPGGNAADILDFAVGDGGDLIDLRQLFPQVLAGWDSATNPFETGFARLFKSGSDMLVQFDRTGGDDGYETLFTLKNVGPTGFTAANFYWQPRVVNGVTRTGTGADEDLLGSEGDDLLDGGAGADTLWGGKGDDVYILDNPGDQAKEAAGEGVDEVRTGLGSRSDFAAMFHLAEHVENLTGTSATGQGVYANALDNVVKMGSGSDLVVLDGGGDDSVSGGGGDDFLYYGAAFTNADSNHGGSGYDTLGLIGTYTLVFDADDLVSIEKLAVYSSGNAALPNSYSLTTIDANVAAGQELQVVAQSLLAGEAFTFNGSAETDGRFNVRGGAGNDTITGGAGADHIWGALGADTIRGGAGKDLFEYNYINESTAGATDVIMDFAAGDKISLVGIDADGSAGNGNQKFAWIGGSAFSGVAGQLRVSQHPDFSRAWVVEGDTNGDQIADFSLILVVQPGYVPVASDFYF